MKVIHRETKQVIEVPSNHADLLTKQGWDYHHEVKKETVVVKEETVHLENEPIKKGKK